MRQYVLTRSSYGPEWDLEANRRRLVVTRALTARTLAAQGVDFTWVVLLDSRDPLLEERLEVFRAAAPNFTPILWEAPENLSHAPWDRKPVGSRQATVAAAAYRHPGWLEATSPRDDVILQTRLDDDDGLSPDALRRFKSAARRVTTRTALMLPVGYRVWQGRFSLVRHDTNAMHTLVTMPGDTTGVYDYGHRLVGRGQPVKIVDERPGWLWYRHPDTLSGWKKADRLLTGTVRARFPVDWRALS